MPPTVPTSVEPPSLHGWDVEGRGGGDIGGHGLGIRTGRKRGVTPPLAGGGREGPALLADRPCLFVLRQRVAANDEQAQAQQGEFPTDTDSTRAVLIPHL